MSSSLGRFFDSPSLSGRRKVLPIVVELAWSTTLVWSRQWSRSDRYSTINIFTPTYPWPSRRRRPPILVVGKLLSVHEW